MLAFNPLHDLPVNNYLGNRILSENLCLVNENARERLFKSNFDENQILRGLSYAIDAVPEEYWDCVLKMIKERIKYAKDFFNKEPL